MVYSSFRFKYQSLIALLNANLLSISTLFCVHPEFLVILIKNFKVMFLILYCSIFKELCAALATAYLLYHIHSSLSSTFLKFFKFLFSEFWTFFPVGHRASAVSSFRFFQLFFVPSTALFLTVQAVWDFLMYPLFSCPLVWVLVYYITENDICQAFFEFFSIFFCIFTFFYLFTAFRNVYWYLLCYISICSDFFLLHFSLHIFTTFCKYFF